MSGNPFRRQLPVHSPLTLRAVLASLSRGDPSPELEATLAGIFGARRVILTDSGTSALALALRAALERRPGGYCLLPGFGCYDLATAALAAGARVLLYDIEPTTLSPRLESLLPAITEECGAVVIVDHYGIPPALDEIAPAAARSGVMVIEDAAQAAGSAWQGVRIGTRTDAAVLSFGRGKGVTAGGGGALLLGMATGGMPDPARLVREATSPAFAAKLVAQYLLARPSVYALPARLPFLKLGETLYREPNPPRGMSRAAARVLAVSLRMMDAESTTRQRNAELLRAAQSTAAPWSLISPDRRAAPGWLRLPVLVPAGQAIDRADAARLGVVPSYPRPLRELGALGGALVRHEELEGAARLARQLWTLPTHGGLDERDRRALDAWIRALVP